MNIWRFLSIIFVGFTVANCAQPRPVTGGEKDTISPKIVQSVPKNFTSGFAGHSIMMEFDEYVQVKSLSAELVVSPPLNNPITYKIKGKRIYFEIEDTLSPNTTYNFNFGNAIIDLNEGNILDSNLFVVSTGTYLDSGIISGVVKDAYTLKAVKDATVLLFPATDDSAIYNGGPSYITKTDQYGKYKLTYLQNIDYQIFTLELPGSEYNYQPYAKVGFYPNLVNPLGNDTTDFFVFNEEDTAQYISKDYSKEFFYFVLGFHSDLVEPEFIFNPSSDSINYIIQELKADSFKFWIEGDLDIDSVTVFVSDRTGYKDTIDVDIEARKLFYKKMNRKNKSKSPLKISLNIKKGVLHYFDSLQLKMSRPPQKWNPDSVLFVHGTDTIPVDSLMKKQLLYMELPYAKKGSTEEILSMPIRYDWQPGQNYALIFYSGAITDVINQTNDTTILKFKTNTFEDYGSFRLTVKVPQYDGPLILETLDERGKFLRLDKIKSGDVIYHKLAVPGKYQFRIIVDQNENDKWDTGELATKTLPETIVYYNGFVEIKPNWDVEETWVVNFRH